MTMPLLTLPKLTRNQRRILEVLYEEGGLTTHLIERYVVPHYSAKRTFNELNKLRTWELIRSAPIGAPGSDEFCWVLTYDGTRALERMVVHQDARYRLPSLAQLAHKTQTVRLAVLLRNLNWACVRPYPYNAVHPNPADTPQRLALVRAVAAHFARTPPGVPGRLHPSQVPGGLNDWVAWPADQPERPLVLILHPVGGSYHFWRSAKRRGAGKERKVARLALYAEVGRVVPVLGVFASRTLATDYAPLLAGGQVRAVTLDELPGLLHSHRMQRQ